MSRSNKSTKSSTSKEIRKKMIIRSTCEECKNTFYTVGRFCDDDCERKWKKRLEQEKEKLKFAMIPCVYKGCRSELPIAIEGRYCSKFCQDEQKRIDRKKNDEIDKRTKKMLKEIEKTEFKPEPIVKEPLPQYQKRVEEMKHNEIVKRTNLIIKEVDALSFDCPTYMGPMEQASNLFGVADIPITKNNNNAKWSSY